MFFDLPDYFRFDCRKKYHWEKGKIYNVNERSTMSQVEYIKDVKDDDGYLCPVFKLVKGKWKDIKLGVTFRFPDECLELEGDITYIHITEKDG